MAKCKKTGHRDALRAPELIKRYQPAFLVYGALRFLAGKKCYFSPTREQIRAVCGLHKDTITKGVTVLHEAGWIYRSYGREGLRRWYRITLPSPNFFPLVAATGHRETGLSGRKPPEGARPYGPSNRPPPLKGGMAAGARRWPTAAKTPNTQHTNLLLAQQKKEDQEFERAQAEIDAQFSRIPAQAFPALWKKAREFSLSPDAPLPENPGSKRLWRKAAVRAWIEETKCAVQ